MKERVLKIKSEARVKMQYKPQNTDFCSQNDELNTLFMKGPYIMLTPHIHETYELYFCPEDIEQNFVICGLQYSHKGPCAILSRPYTVHLMSCTESCETEYVRIAAFFGEKVINSLGENLPNEISDNEMCTLFKLTPEEADCLYALIRSGYDDEDETTARSENELIFAAFMNKLFRLCDKTCRVELGNSSNYVGGVMRYISEHCDENTDIAVLAKKFAVSRSKLDRDFRAVIGVTPKSFADECRLNRAKNLIIGTDFSISEISAACGFISENYFFRFFKKHTGMSPLKYRKENKK